MVEPFPWTSLEVTTRADAAALHALRTWGTAHARLDTLAGALSSLVETRVQFLLRRAGSRAASGVLDDGVGVVLAPGDAPFDLQRAVLVEAEGTLAANLVLRSLRRKPPAVYDRGRPASPGVAGAFGAIAATAARRAHAGNALRVIAAGPSSALLDNLARTAGDVLVASFTVLVGQEAFLARAVVPRVALRGSKTFPWTREALRALGSLPMSIPIVATSAVWSARELASLRAGDAWVPSAWPLAREGQGLAGEVTLVGPKQERGLSARVESLGEGGHLVLGGEVRDLSWSAEDGVTGSQDTTDALVESLGDVPVVVRVEVGAAQMPARAWADVGVGDVVALGRRIADPVVLRVGGVEVARGELVDLEGEVGVRIVERLAPTTEKTLEVEP